MRSTKYPKLQRSSLLSFFYNDIERIFLLHISLINFLNIIMKKNIWWNWVGNVQNTLRNWIEMLVLTLIMRHMRLTYYFLPDYWSNVGLGTNANEIEKFKCCLWRKMKLMYHSWELLIKDQRLILHIYCTISELGMSIILNARALGSWDEIPYMFPRHWNSTPMQIFTFHV